MAESATAGFSDLISNYRTLWPLYGPQNTGITPRGTRSSQHRRGWQVELFFEWIKQHLRIKACYGTCENAVKTQIPIAVSLTCWSLSLGNGSDCTPASTRFYSYRFSSILVFARSIRRGLNAKDDSSPGIRRHGRGRHSGRDVDGVQFGYSACAGSSRQQLWRRSRRD
jgi:hypothetical protein